MPPIHTNNPSHRDLGTEENYREADLKICTGFNMQCGQNQTEYQYGIITNVDTGNGGHTYRRLPKFTATN